MTDSKLRELQRRWQESGSVEDEAAYLLERVRVGDLEQEKLELAAHCGHPAALSATQLHQMNTIEELLSATDVHGRSAWLVAGRQACTTLLAQMKREVGCVGVYAIARQRQRQAIEDVLTTLRELPANPTPDCLRPLCHAAEAALAVGRRAAELNEDQMGEHSALQARRAVKRPTLAAHALKATVAESSPGRAQTAYRTSIRLVHEEFLAADWDTSELLRNLQHALARWSLG